MAARWAGIDSEISIHALREEGDAIPPQATGGILIFLSTPSARRATEIPYSQYTVKEFLSTPSARRATSRQMVQSLTTLISIHALREEGDLSGSGGQQSMANFYPRPPRGGRPRLVGCGYKRLAISIHALREEGDP